MLDSRPIIERIYLDKHVQNSALAKLILKKLSHVPITMVSDKDRFFKQTESITISAGKRTLWLTEFKGPFLKPCPATGQDYLCCQYWTINAQTHCPLDCTYCILQHYLNMPLITIYTNIENITKEMNILVKNYPKRLFRFGTGELTDSLALDPLTRLNEKLIRYALQKKIILEIKTKTDLIEHLPKIPKSNVLISWSLNPEEFIKTEEFKSASFERRIASALTVIQKGYRLGFHFDPLLILPGWKKKYKWLIQELTQQIPEGDVMWISLGSLRFPPSLKKIIDKRFPKSKITTAPWVKGLDGKIRYFRPERTALYRYLYAEIRKKWKKVFIYFCMENPTVWQEVMGFSPQSNQDLDYLFHKSIYQRFADLKLPVPNLKNYKKMITLLH
ncbi:MAG TPA: radical SAM protein [Candidatus Omnitrophota bacterium]|nr:radical SAM protein [Candidatus Omnitrophota bacterium]